MTEALRKKLEDQLKEELADCQKYLQLAKEYEAECQYNKAGILRDISDEEHTHALLLEHILEIHK